MRNVLVPINIENTANQWGSAIIPYYYYTMGLPEGYTFRALEQGDYFNNYVETLKTLTTVGDISSPMFIDLVTHWQSRPDLYHPSVITNEKGVVVATGMLLVERKLIHECGLVGHIEDISVALTEQGKRLGHTMVTTLLGLAEKAGCYKVILDCSPENEGFYQKCGLKNAGIEMTKRFD